MPPAATLPDAAGAAYDNLYVKFVGGTLKADTAAFALALNVPGLFEEQTESDHPMINWISVIAALAESMVAISVSYAQLNADVMYVYRACWMANTSMYSTAQKTAVLAAYNTNFT